MKRKIIASLQGIGLAFTIVFSNNSLAQWFESTGHAVVKNGDTSQAKSAAIKDAITQALVFSGARVTSVQTLVDGVLTQDQLKISSHGEIQKIELISEDRHNDTYAITLRLDIFPQAEECPANQYTKFIAVTQSQLVNREQARMGQIFDVNKAISEQLYASLSNTQMAAKPTAYYNVPLRVDHFFTQQYDYSNALLEEITSRSNSQYVLLSRIRDLSVNKSSTTTMHFGRTTALNVLTKSIMFYLMAQPMKSCGRKAIKQKGSGRTKKPISSMFTAIDFGQPIMAVQSVM